MTEKPAKDIEREVQALLAPFGLKTFGWFNDEGQVGLLIGNIGGSHWAAFKQSNEAHDGEPDPMNRWTERVVAPIVSHFTNEVRYPFGDQIWPFQRYAQLATGMRQSPIGLLIHPEFGLWTAFRAALMFCEIDLPKSRRTAPHPCDSCQSKPCLTSCPIEAFTERGFDYQSCRSYIRSSAGENCLAGGCLARKACPVGADYIYEEDHQAFHMKAFS